MYTKTETVCEQIEQVAYPATSLRTQKNTIQEWEYDGVIRTDIKKKKRADLFFLVFRQQ